MIDISSTHGTGCTLSAAITAQLAIGKSMPDAISIAQQYVHAAIEHSFQWQSPSGKTISALDQINTH